MTQLRSAKSYPSDQSASAYDLDHVVIVVDNLDRAVRDYRALGFTVAPPQKAEGSGVARAYICFADTEQTYLELISLSHSKLATRALHGLKVFGFAGVRRDALARRALLRAAKGKTGDVGTDASSFPLTDVLNGISFRHRQPEEDFFSSLTEDSLPQQRSAQNSEGALTRHANGATGVATITVAVENLEQKVAACSALLGSRPFYRLDSPLLSVRTASFSLGGTTLKLAQPTGPGAVKDYLKYGEGPCVLTLQTTADTGRLDDGRTHGLRLELIGGDMHTAT